MKQGQKRLLTPMEIPEVLHIIDRELTHRDRIACMLVCRAWQKGFEMLTWRNQIYNRTGLPGIEKNGYLIYSLKVYFPLDEHHLKVIALHCPSVVCLDLDISPNAPPCVVDSFMASMTNVQHLRLKLRESKESKFLCCLTRLANLRTLRIVGGTGVQLCSEPSWFITLLQALPTLRSVSIDGSLKESHFENLFGLPNPIRGIEYNVAARPLSWRQWALSFFQESKLSPEIRQYQQELAKAQRKEPWRKFVPLTLPPVEAVSPTGNATSPPLPDSYKLLNQVPAPDQMIHITCLVLSLRATTALPLIADSFLRLLPRLKEVDLDFGSVYGYPAIGLAQMSEHCRLLQSIRLKNIFCMVPPQNSWNNTSSTNSSNTETQLDNDLVRSFRNMPPRVQSLSLVNCTTRDLGLTDIPSEVLQGLQSLEIMNTGCTQKTIHDILVRCPRLTTLTIGCPSNASNTSYGGQSIPGGSSLAMIGQGDHFLGSLHQPWECTWSLRRVDMNRWCMVEIAAFDALFGRIEMMPCLTWLSMSIGQVKVLIKSSMEQKLYLNVSNSCNGDNNNANADSISVVEQPPPVRWNFFSLLDLRLSRVDWFKYPTTNIVGQTLSCSELKCILLSTPNLRRFWYESVHYPFDKNAEEWLRKVRKDISIEHCSTK